MNTLTLDPRDTLEARLIQAQASLAAIQNTWDDDESGYKLPPLGLHHALWALEELLAQAVDALSVTEDSAPIAARDVALPAAA